MRKRFRRVTSRRPAPESRGEPMFDALEPRQLLATFIVNSAADAGAGTLRQAVADANAAGGADTILFDASLTNSTITLNSGFIQITDALTIRGTDSEGNRLGINVSGSAVQRHFVVTDSNSGSDFAVTMSDLSLSNGFSNGTDGGSIFNEENLTLERVTLSNNSTAGIASGGAIKTSGVLTIRNSLLRSNFSAADGGAIINDGRAFGGGATLTVINSSIDNNSANQSGGGIMQNGRGALATLTIQNSTIANNRADFDNNNPAGHRGGGFMVFSTGTWSLTSTIVASNVLGNPGAFDEIDLGDGFATLTSAANNLIRDAGTAGGITDGTNGNIVGQDPMLSAAANAGGPTRTLAPMPGSPAIDAGSNPLALTTDQRDAGFARTSGAGTDIGAFESQSISVVVSSSDDGVVMAGDSSITLREAISLTNNNPGADTIAFVQSLSGSTITLNSGQLSILDDLTLTGLGSGNLAVDGNAATRIFLVDDFDYTSNKIVSMSGLTIQNGAAGLNNFGSGLANEDDLTLTDVVVTGNTLVANNGDLGAGIYNGFQNFGMNGLTGANLTLVNSTVSNNTFGSGAGIYSDGNLTLTDSTISGNAADANGIGGGVNFAGNTLVVTGSTFSGNSADQGGGMFAVTMNTATITNSTFTGNTSSISGGGILIAGGASTFSILNTTLSNNSASASGGGLAVFGHIVTITNSTISGNTAAGTGGGGIANFGGLLTIQNSTIAFNTDTGGTAGGYLAGAAADTLTSTIVANNTASSGGSTGPSDIGLNGGSIAPGSANNLIGDAGTAGGLTDGTNGNLVGRNAMLAALASNGGTTQTHALMAGSPAIDTGSAQSNLTTDQRGGLFARSVDAAPDIGAYERQTLALVVGTTESTEDGDLSAGDLSIREALRFFNANPLDDTISFDESLSGQTITLFGSSLQVADDGTITGLGADLLTIDGNANSRVFTVTDGSAGTVIAVTISGLTMTNGAIANGGAIDNLENLTLEGVTITGNTATNDGGGIHNTGTLTISNSTITGNMSTDSGGAIDNDGATTMTISGSTITGNMSGGDAGAIDNDANGTLTITGSTVSNNTAGGAGGAIANAGALSIVESTLDGNTAADAGGAIDNFGGSATIERSALTNNTAGGSGGAVFTDTELVVRSSTLSGNSAGDFGGAIGMFDGTVVVDNSTIAFNHADANDDGFGQGGGIDVGRRSGAGTLTTTSSIYAGNTRGGATTTADDISLTDGTVTGSSNLVQDADTAGGLTDGQNGNILGRDPELSVLADNGGPTQTHAIFPGSPAFNAGTASGGVATDQRGEARTQGAGVDIGAYEWRPTADFSIRVIADGLGQTASVSGDTHFHVVRNADGDLIVFAGNGSVWTTQRIRDYVDAPAVTGDPVVWTDPADGLVYVAAPSAEGFILHRRAADGTWSVQNLTTLTGASTADSPTGVLTSFTSRPQAGPGVVAIAGFTASGEIVAFQQTGTTTDGRADWTFFNISDDLASQSMATPVFTQMTSYVTSWNQWTLAGLDASGNVQGVWVNVASFTTWRVDNLSTITGADPLAGQLDVTLTPWGGIRFVGANSQGRLIGTWWNPARGPGNWSQTDMSAQVPSNAPILSGGQLTAWFTPSNIINYAGFDASGDVIRLYWRPGDGGVWSSDNLTAGLSNRSERPVGNVSAGVSDAGSVSVIGAAGDGDLVRIFSADGEDGTFQLFNLTDLAVRI